MHLVIGDSGDLASTAVAAALAARGRPARIIRNPVLEPNRLAWRFDTDGSQSSLVLDDGPALGDDDLESVFVARVGWVDPSGWPPRDLSYVQSETQAALLAWLWSRPCPVVNRAAADVWYRPRRPLVAWHEALHRCGLAPLETLVTNLAADARTFASSSESQDLAAVVGPLTSDVRYIVASDRDLAGVAALLQTMPAALTRPHGGTVFACLVGEEVVWSEPPTVARARLEPAIRRFGAAAGLDLLQLAVATAADSEAVIDVDPRPELERFDAAGRSRIAHGIAGLLLADHAVGSASERLA